MTQKIGPFLGINNRRPDFGLRIKTNQVQGDYLRSAINVDIDDTGRLLRRKQSVLVQAMSGAHSLYLTSETEGYFVKENILYAVTLLTYSETIVKVLTCNERMSYVQAGADLYYSNGTDSGRITSGAVYPLGLPTPAAPTLTAIGGNLLKGAYRVAVAHVNATTGEEGGLSDASQFELTDTGGLRATLPAATAGASHVNVYLSGANGEVMQRAATVASGTALVDLTSLATGAESSVRRESPLPAGTLFMSNCRLCSYAGDTVYIGHPYRPGYYDPLEGYIPFWDDVTLAIDVQGGVFVAADKTYFFAGDLTAKEGQVRDVLPYGAVPGTAFAAPDKTLFGWFGAQGIVLASPAGEVETVMADNVTLTPPASGISTVFEDGYRRVVSAGWCLNLSNKAATQYDGWDFTSFSGSYGTRADGIYSLADGGSVAWSVGLGKQDFGTDALKHLPNAYLGVQSADLIQLQVQAPGDVDYTYDARSNDEEMRVQRIDAGKGMRANWFDLTLTSETGADFVLESVSFAATTTKRRI